MKPLLRHLAFLLCSSIIQITAFSSDLIVVSSSQNDTNLIRQGYELFTSAPASPWVNGTTTGQIQPRFNHTAVWTDSGMVLWGGNLSANQYSASGGMYQPRSDTWVAMSPINAPVERADHSALWTGKEMIVWGGFNTTGFKGDGGRFNPTNQSWQNVSTSLSPTARSDHVGIWIDARMLVWSGRNNNGYLNDGGLYDPETDTWHPLLTANPPSARSRATAVWTGYWTLVWGGQGPLGELNTGGRLAVVLGRFPTTWTPISHVGAPAGRSDHSAVWTGNRMIIWGGNRAGIPLGDGASYDPTTDQWTPISSAHAPSARSQHTAVWTGREMLIWGGHGPAGSLASGGAYDPVTDSWRELNQGGTPLPRGLHTAAWSGEELLVFGGHASGSPLSALQRLNPEPTWYLYRAQYSPRPLPLEISLAGSGIQLRWPLTNSAGFVLEHTVNPGPGEFWTPVARPPQITNDQHVVTLAPVTGVHFFRLRRP